MLDFGFYNMDCNVALPEFPDNYFDLAVVDPPYGIKVFCKGQRDTIEISDVKIISGIRGRRSGRPRS